MEAIRRAIEALGFTSTEADCYLHLLQHGEGTGYAIAKGLGRPAAQVYTALESLLGKGAVLATDGEPRRWLALEPGVLLAQLERAFGARLREAARALAEVPSSGTAASVFRLQTTAQVEERLKQMLEAAQDVVLVDAFPAVLGRILPELLACARGGVRVAVKSYAECPEAELEVYRPADAASIVRDVPGQVLQCAVDGEQFLAALFDEELSEVRSAMWSADPLIAGLQHNGLACELGYTRFGRLVHEGADAGELASVADRLSGLMWRDTPGFAGLRERYAGYAGGAGGAGRGGHTGALPAVPG